MRQLTEAGVNIPKQALNGHSNGNHVDGVNGHTNGKTLSHLTTLETPPVLAIETGSTLSVENVFAELFDKYLFIPPNPKAPAHSAVTAEVRHRDRVLKTWDFWSVGDSIFHIGYTTGNKTIGADFIGGRLSHLAELTTNSQGKIRTTIFEPTTEESSRITEQLLKNALSLKTLGDNEELNVVFKNMIGRNSDRSILKPRKPINNNQDLVERVEDATRRTRDIWEARVKGKPVEHLSYHHAFGLIERAALNEPREGTLFPLPPARSSPLLTYLEKHRNEAEERRQRARVAYDSLLDSRPTVTSERVQPLGPKVS